MRKLSGLTAAIIAILAAAAGLAGCAIGSVSLAVALAVAALAAVAFGVSCGSRQRSDVPPPDVDGAVRAVVEDASVEESPAPVVPVPPDDICLFVGPCLSDDLPSDIDDSPPASTVCLHPSICLSEPRWEPDVPPPVHPCLSRPPPDPPPSVCLRVAPPHETDAGSIEPCLEVVRPPRPRGHHGVCLSIDPTGLSSLRGPDPAVRSGGAAEERLLGRGLLTKDQVERLRRLRAC